MKVTLVIRDHNSYHDVYELVIHKDGNMAESVTVAIDAQGAEWMELQVRDVTKRGVRIFDKGNRIK